jgi:hypothetical protein
MGASFVSSERAACRDCATAQGVRTSNPIVEQAVERGELLWRSSPHGTWTARKPQETAHGEEGKEEGEEEGQEVQEAVTASLGPRVSH